jgi:isochorismate synthase
MKNERDIGSRISVSNTEISESELLHLLIQHAAESDQPFAFWQLPNSTKRYFIISQHCTKLDGQWSVEDCAPGFIFAPFDREKARYYLAADLIFCFEHGTLLSPETPAEGNSEAWLIEKLKTAPIAKPVKFRSPGTIAASADNFLQTIVKSVEEIERGTFEKVVPSRTHLIDLPHDFDVVTAFEKLCDRYQQAFISFVSIPGIGHWLGATPEVLVTLEDKTIFKTVALAGTKPFYEGTNLKTVAWTQKEIEEQALVERYVISCFKKIRLREYDEHGPKTVVAGNVMHLKSDFTVNIKETNFPQLASVMLELLHPTSAVCGAPLEPALNFLKNEEGYDREFYAGYLGPVNVQNDIHIFVNLRCMQLSENKALLYAGAGVTIDSIPEEEFEETEIKFNTLLNVIR